jgi:uncharacterized repeat protein (TIGR03843 family)
MPALQRIPAYGMNESLEVISLGTLEVIGRLVDASNATLYGEVSSGAKTLKVIYKPIAGERPLWDFQDGNLASREVAAYKVSEIAGFHLVPRTVLRDGPFGLGSVQEWIEQDENSDVIALGQSDSPAIRSLALFDVLINNTDRKFGHILLDKESRIFGCDHGVTFHAEPKLRTVLWQFAGLELTSDELNRLSAFESYLGEGSDELDELINPEEFAALRKRCQKLLQEKIFPYPSEEWPAVPWPPV